MRHSSHANSHLKASGVNQEVAHFEETIVLLKILALGNQEVEAGKVKPVADVVARLRSKAAWQTCRGR